MTSEQMSPRTKETIWSVYVVILCTQVFALHNCSSEFLHDVACMQNNPKITFILQFNIHGMFTQNVAAPACSLFGICVYTAEIKGTYSLKLCLGSHSNLIEYHCQHMQHYEWFSCFHSCKLYLLALFYWPHAVSWSSFTCCSWRITQYLHKLHVFVWWKTWCIAWH